MNSNELTKIQNKQQMPAGGYRSTATEDARNDKTNLLPSTAEVADRAHSNWLKQGSLAGQDVQHWLDAERELIAEKNWEFSNGSHNKERMLASGCQQTAADVAAKK